MLVLINFLLKPQLEVHTGTADFMETGRYHAYNKAQVQSMMCPTVLVLGMCPDNAMPAYCGGAQLIRRPFVCFGFIWEILVDGHTRVPPSWGAGNRDYGISASGTDVFRV